MAAPGLANHLAVLGDVVVGYAVNGFAVPDACQIVGIADNVAALGAAGGLDLRHHCLEVLLSIHN